MSLLSPRRLLQAVARVLARPATLAVLSPPPPPPAYRFNKTLETILRTLTEPHARSPVTCVKAKAEQRRPHGGTSYVGARSLHHAGIGLEHLCGAHTALLSSPSTLAGCFRSESADGMCTCS